MRPGRLPIMLAMLAAAAAAPGAAAMTVPPAGPYRPRRHNETRAAWFRSEVIARLPPGSRVTSHERTRERNAAIGGSSGSWHVLGLAADLTHPNGPAWLARQLVQVLPSWDQIIVYAPGRSSHVHVGAAPPGELFARRRTTAALAVGGYRDLPGIDQAITAAGIEEVPLG